MTSTRRIFLKQAALLVFAARGPAHLRAVSAIDAAEESMELAHTEIWKRFLDPQDVLLDYTDLDGSVSLPTPEECREGKPNALGWWSPIENGAMFNGLYLDGMVNRALQTKLPTDATKARRLVEGLLRLSACSAVKGFIGRGFATDRRTSWPMGSNDQTGPWFYGLWRFHQSGLGDEALRQRIVANFKEVAEVLVETGWRMPAEAPFHFRGSFNGFAWENASRLLFVCKAVHQFTGDAAWEARYRAALAEVSPKDGKTRLAACEEGLKFALRPDGKPRRETWTGSVPTVCLRGLWEMEHDEDLRTSYARGLRATAELAATSLADRAQFSSEPPAAYDGDWRKLNAFWKPQQTEQEAEVVAHLQIPEMNRLSPARRAELGIAREVMFAAWAVTLCPEREIVQRFEAEILATIAHFRADQLRFVSFFPLESAFWRLTAR